MEAAAPGPVGLDELRATGRGSEPELVGRRIAGVTPSDVATIVDTSGTTGKGCVTTHENLRATVSMYETGLELGGGLVMYLYLPLAHSLARIAQAVTLEVGGTLALWGGDPKQIIDEIARLRSPCARQDPRGLRRPARAGDDRRCPRSEGRSSSSSTRAASTRAASSSWRATG